jgi:hypothetical protein
MVFGFVVRFLLAPPEANCLIINDHPVSEEALANLAWKPTDTVQEVLQMKQRFRAQGSRSYSHETVDC